MHMAVSTLTRFAVCTMNTRVVSGILQPQPGWRHRAYRPRSRCASADRPLSLQGKPTVPSPPHRTPTCVAQVTLHQGMIEANFLDSMAAMGLEVERPIVPTSIQLSTDETVLKDPSSYAVTVRPRSVLSATRAQW